MLLTTSPSSSAKAKAVDIMRERKRRKSVPLMLAGGAASSAAAARWRAHGAGRGKGEGLHDVPGILAQIVVVDVFLRSEHLERRAGQRLGLELGRRQAGMDVERIDLVLLGQRVGQRSDRAIVADAVARDDVLQFRAERQVSCSDAAHGERHVIVQFVLEFRLRMLAVHRHAHPEIFDLDVLEPFGIDSP